MVIVNNYLNFFAGRYCGKITDAALLPGINHDQTPDICRIDIFQTLKRKSIAAGTKEKIMETALRAAGQHHFRFRIEMAGGQHRCQAVEISIDMRSYYFDHLRTLSGMKFTISLFQAFGINLRIDLGCGQVSVTQKGLHNPQIGSAGKQMGRKRVP